MGEAAEILPPELERVAETERGTAVYLLKSDIPDILMPKGGGRRGIGAPQPKSPLAAWLLVHCPQPACIIIRYRRYARIFKITPDGEVFPITARSIKLEDRLRLVEQGLLNKT